MKELSNKQKSVQSKVGKKLAKLEREKASRKCNKSNLRLWLNPRGVNIAFSSMEFQGRCVIQARAILKKYGESEGVDRVFGVNCQHGTPELIIEAITVMVNNELARLATQVEKDCDDLEKLYISRFGSEPQIPLYLKGKSDKSALKKYILGAFQRDSLKAKQMHCTRKPGSGKVSGLFNSAKNRKKLSRGKAMPIGHRFIGCGLDKQAVKLGIAEKEFTVLRYKDARDINPVEVKMPYYEMKRIERKKVNHSYYKKSQAA